jgi:hypothetical protein
VRISIPYYLVAFLIRISVKFGSIPGIEVGTWWQTRYVAAFRTNFLACAECGLHVGRTAATIPSTRKSCRILIIPERLNVVAGPGLEVYLGPKTTAHIPLRSREDMTMISTSDMACKL